MNISVERNALKNKCVFEENFFFCYASMQDRSGWNCCHYKADACGNSEMVHNNCAYVRFGQEGYTCVNEEAKIDAVIEKL